MAVRFRQPSFLPLVDMGRVLRRPSPFQSIYVHFLYLFLGLRFHFLSPKIILARRQRESVARVLYFKRSTTIFQPKIGIVFLKKHSRNSLTTYLMYAIL